MQTRAAVATIADPDSAVMAKAYARWAPVYDAVCGPVMEPGRKAGAAAARDVGGEILEVGVGTGLSFDDYDSSTEVTGIDFSAPMIEKARSKLASGKYPHIKDVQVMDAHAMEFPDNSFDCAVAQFVITLVADPERVLDECARVVRPGGEIILVNHLYSERGMLAAIERWTASYAHSVGLRPEFPFARFEAWVRQHGGVELIGRRKLKPLGIYTLVRFRKLSEPRTAVAA